MPTKNLALKIAIIQSGLSQADVAEAAGWHASKFSLIVNGRQQATEAERKIIARILKRKAADLFPPPAETTSAA